MAKTYKKGTKIKLAYECNIVGGDDSEIEVLEDDCTEDDLQQMAQDFMENCLAPCAWFEVIETQDQKEGE